MMTDFLTLSDELFLKIGKMITERYGIKMPPEKKIMFQARLQRRLRELNLKSFSEYADRLFLNNGDSDEFTLLADYVSTNKTDFFREKDHFDFLVKSIISTYHSEQQYVSQRHCNIWSAGCSSGQEAYSIAVTLEEFRRKNDFKLNFSITATDISSKVLKLAKEAIYPITQLDEVPLEIKQRYFLKSKSELNTTVRVVKELRDKVQLSYLNLMDGSYPFPHLFDIVFLRNTLIYFDANTQRNVLTKVLRSLKTGGLLFIGHSESLINMDLPIRSVAPSVYVKIEEHQE